MLAMRRHEFPPDKEQHLKKAQLIEWLTVFFVLSIVVVMYAVIGASQAMKTAWVEDILSLIPPLAFLIAGRIARRPPSDEYPYGCHRAVTIAFLCGSVALFTLGLLLLGNGIYTLLQREHPTIQSVEVLGHTVWLGWLMIAALTYSMLPPIILGHFKLPLAEELHDKTLFADASMDKAAWRTAVAAIIGVLGIGIGWWWADAVAACVISIAVTRDGYKNLVTATTDLMDRHPMKIDEKHREDLPERLVDLLKTFDWVLEAEVRLREEGHVFMGEAFIVPANGETDPGRLLELTEAAQDLDWRIHELVIMPVERLARPGRGT
jgi:divalent metal cation (Fe/Co/Zn/Cd) transporter